MEETLANRWYGLLFGVRRSIRYHMRRVWFFDWLNTCSTALSLLLGSVTVVALLGGRDSTWAIVAAATVTVVSTVNLIVGSTRRAREHHDLARRFLTLEREIVKARVAEEFLEVFTDQRLEIEADEPPVLRNLDILCHNEQLRAEGRPAKYYVPVAWWRRWLAQVSNVGADRYASQNGA